MYLCYFLSPEVISAVYMLLIKWMRLRKRCSDISRAIRFSIIFISSSNSLSLFLSDLGFQMHSNVCFTKLATCSLFFYILLLHLLFDMVFCCNSWDENKYIIPTQNRIGSHRIISNRSQTTKRHSLFMKWLDNDDRQQFSEPIFIERVVFFALRRFHFSSGQSSYEENCELVFSWICILSWYTRRLVMLGNRVHWNRIQRKWHSNIANIENKNSFWFIEFSSLFNCFCFSYICIETSVCSNPMVTTASFLSCTLL